MTSRSPVWAGVAQPVGVDVFVRSESVALLRTHLPQVSDAEVDQLAEALGDLPLAVAQAADLLAETGMPVPDYLRALDEHAADLFGDRPPVGYPAPGSCGTSRRRTSRPGRPGRRTTAAPVRVPRPEPVPLHLFRHAPDQALPEPLAATASSGIALDRTVGHIARYGLARPSADGPSLHRLTQAILRTPSQSSRAPPTASRSTTCSSQPDPMMAETPSTGPAGPG
ncbi:hypothetical protein NKG94_46465 [Micromonospora sp. M12]